MSFVNTTFLCFLAPCLFFVQSIQAQTLACSDDVYLRTGRVSVAANGVDDTENIQCALDEAKRLRIPVVRLVSDVYYISYIQIEEFNGALEGRGRDETTVVVLNDSIDCQQTGENDLYPAALKFVNGDVELRFMTIGADSPCSRHSSPPSIVLVHFTGPGIFSGCTSGTGYGVVNRVNLVSLSPPPQWPESGQFIAGVRADPEIWSTDTCRTIQSGIVRLQRSFLGGFAIAVRLHLQASSLVDIAFNEFVDNRDDVFSFDANQLLSVQSNTIVKAAVKYGWGVGLFDPYAPWDTRHDRAVIYKNTFSLESAAIAILAMGTTKRSVAISANRFGGNNYDNRINYDNLILLAGTHRANVTDNAFEGKGGTAVGVGGFENNITGNDFAGFCADEADIFLDEETSGNIVGPGQDARVQDFGTGNHVLGGFETPAKTDCDISSISQSDQVLAAKARYQELKTRISALLDARHGDSG